MLDCDDLNIFRVVKTCLPSYHEHIMQYFATHILVLFKKKENVNLVNIDPIFHVPITLLTKVFLEFKMDT